MSPTRTELHCTSGKICEVSHLQSTDGCTLETQVCLEILSDFPDETLEGQLPDEQLGRLLVTTDLTQGDGPGPVKTKCCIKNTEPQQELAQHKRLFPSDPTYLYLWGFFTPPVEGALFLAALVASCFLGAFPPVDLRAVCLVRAKLHLQIGKKHTKHTRLADRSHSILSELHPGNDWFESPPRGGGSTLNTKLFHR